MHPFLPPLTYAQCLDLCSLWVCQLFIGGIPPSLPSEKVSF